MINTELIMNGKTIKSADEVDHTKQLINEAQDNRVISVENGKAEVLVTKENILISNGSNYLNVNQHGTTVDGKFHMAAEPNKIRVNGYWTLNDELLTTLPSTIYTPLPVLVYSEPLAAERVQDMFKFLKGMA